MPNSLTSTQVAALTKDGDWRVDRNLFVQIRDGGQTRSWVFRYRYHGRLRRMGLGPVRLFSLTDVRKKVVAALKLLADGIDPLVEKKLTRIAAATAAGALTFEVVAGEYIASRKGAWRDPVRAERWAASLKTHAAVISRLPVTDVTTDDVLRALKPIWTKKSDMAGKVRGRIENILDYAIAMKYRPEGPNPAAWKGPLGKLLPPLSQVRTIVHHPSVPFAEIPALYARIRAVGSVAARALGFTLLTAVRSSEARLARWREFDLQAKTWTIPAERTKMNVEHVVPLTDGAIALLPDLGKPDALVFPGRTRAEPLSDATMLKALRTLTKDDATVHGLRATFRTWAAEATDYPREIAEAALSHRVGDDVERAYARTTFFDKRKAMMEEWSGFATQRPHPASTAPGTP
jgi:integrase